MTDKDFYIWIERKIISNTSSAYCSGISCSDCNYYYKNNYAQTFSDVCILMKNENSLLKPNEKLKILNEKLKIKYFEYKSKILTEKLND